MNDNVLTDAHELHQALEVLIERVGALNEAQVCCHNVSYSEYRALRTVQRGEPLPLSALATTLQMSPSGLTRVIDRLARKLYVRRVADGTDGRVASVEILPAGALLLQNIDAEATQFVERLLTQVPLPLRPSLLPVLRALVDAAQTVEFAP